MLASAMRTLIVWEIKYFFLNPRQALFLPLLFGGVLLAMWPWIGSPYVPVMPVVVLGLEREFNNILNRWPSQYAASLLLPLDWRQAVLAKNLATILLTLLLTLVSSVVVLYFAPELPGTGHTALAALYLLSVLFPLLVAGNARSAHSPRTGEAFELDDLPEAVITAVTLGLASIPFGICWGILRSPLLALVYSAAALLYWLVVSVPRTARAAASAIPLRRMNA